MLLTLSNENLNDYVESVKTKLMMNASLMAMMKVDGDYEQWHYYLAKENAFNEMLWLVGIGPGVELYNTIKDETSKYYVDEIERFKKYKEDGYYD